MDAMNSWVVILKKRLETRLYHVDYNQVNDPSPFKSNSISTVIKAVELLYDSIW